MVELHSMKYIIFGFFTELFTIIKTRVARCKQLVKQPKDISYCVTQPL